MDIEQEFARIEAGIRRLKVEYDVFFGGGSKLPPLALQRELQQTIKQISNRPLLRTSDRFQLNTLVGRFNSLTELWGKQMRSREEGRDMTGAPLHESHGRAAGAPRQPVRVVVSDPSADAPHLQRFYDRWMDARREAGENPRVSFDSFVKQISKQVSGLQASRGCREVEFHLDTTGGQVVLKARPLDSAVTTREVRR